MKKGFIEFDGGDFDEKTRDFLLKAGVPEVEVNWLAPIISHRDFFGPVDDVAEDQEVAEALWLNEVEGRAQHIGDHFEEYRGERDPALVHSFHDFVFRPGLLGDNHQPIDWGRTILESVAKNVSKSESFSVSNDWIWEWRDRGKPKWGKGMLQILLAHGASSLDPGLLKFVNLACGGESNSSVEIDFTPILDLQAVRDSATGKIETAESKPCHLFFWMYEFPCCISMETASPLQDHKDRRSYIGCALDRFFPLFKNEPDATIGNLAYGLYRIILEAVGASGQKDFRPDSFAPFAPALAPYFREMQERIERGVVVPNLTRMRWAYARYAFVKSANEKLRPSAKIEEAEREKLLKSASEELGRLRALLQNADQEGASNRFDYANIEDMAHFALQYGDPLKTIKALLLAFRALNVPAVASDLRYWMDRGRDDPPWPWNALAMTIVGSFRRLNKMMPEDPQLEAVREAFSTFCLERLKSKQPAKKGTWSKGKVLCDADMVEENSNWRFGYVCALRELKINPRGKGHHILHWCSQNDPDKHVCSAAKTAYKEMRHGSVLQVGLSPVRPLLAAFWWLRQAHLLSLGIVPDKPGAQRTRSKEVTWTAFKKE